MTDIEQVPMIGISLNGELPGKKNIVLQGHIERDCPPAELNAILDKMRVAMDRQFAFGAIVQLQLQLEQEENIASDHAMRMAQVDANIQREWARGNKKGDVHLSQKQQQDQAQAYAHAEGCKKRIAKVKDEIRKFEALIGA